MFRIFYLLRHGSLLILDEHSIKFRYRINLAFASQTRTILAYMIAYARVHVISVEGLTMMKVFNPSRCAPD